MLAPTSVALQSSVVLVPSDVALPFSIVLAPCGVALPFCGPRPMAADQQASTSGRFRPAGSNAQPCAIFSASSNRLDSRASPNQSDSRKRGSRASPIPADSRTRADEKVAAHSTGEPAALAPAATACAISKFLEATLRFKVREHDDHANHCHRALATRTPGRNFRLISFGRAAERKGNIFFERRGGRLARQCRGRIAATRGSIGITAPPL